MNLRVLLRAWQMMLPHLCCAPLVYVVLLFYRFIVF